MRIASYLVLQTFERVAQNPGDAEVPLIAMEGHLLDRCINSALGPDVAGTMCYSYKATERNVMKNKCRMFAVKVTSPCHM